MILTDVAPLPDSALPLEAFKAHLRLGTGFPEDSLQDGVLNGFLRAALSAIEARTGKILITRSFTWEQTRWRNAEAEILPVAPVTSVTEIVMRDSEGGEVIVDPALYRLERDTHHPKLCPQRGFLPIVAKGGSVRVSFAAGLAPDWGGLPADLAQAVLMLAAHYYEYREDTGLHGGCMPFGVTSLIERYRAIRLSLGAVQ
ncbi:head-tail connector protein [Phaeobacter gallaeciensis]|uniref:head-tail connector protein n=1 Tax=Phaeobacter gallaeciensis TaxID=60890 RepID=UPI00237EF744|nr:head-tail connector protein [Phaeobacter gallaeciensis]MDE4192781.1 head-tail connector protein [Phaeobacter gallaeciensis]MDE4201122.1 head-tail connector protein [Phaeobacter gallaeciensis]MDE4205397.1 head-tail connector protein [Phaeobacter gallaeciensis]MDE4209445.1 head-tail connector protein [Phaeobacter gallaeciensis]MDE4217904.1 head-tail connector protein [Phaeobacter gallaeciensis]